MGVALGRVSKDIREPIRGLTKLYLSNIHVMRPTLKKYNGLAGVMKDLMRDFSGP